MNDFEIVPPEAKALFTHSTVTLGFTDPVPDFAVVREKIAATQQDDFFLRRGAAADEIVLDSLTGHSRLTLGRGRAVLATRYSGSYQEVGEGYSSERRDYAIKKIRTVCRLLDAAKVSTDLFGVTISGRVGGPLGLAPQLRGAVLRAYPLGMFLPDSKQVYDFQVRASYVASDTCFANTILSWFQERTLQVELTPETREAVLKEWDSVLSGEGVAVDFDLNNKRALFEKPAQKWGCDDYAPIVDLAFEDADAELLRTFNRIRAQWSQK